MNDYLQELFGVIGPLKRANLLAKGHAEVAYIHKDHAVAALKKYHNRELDGKIILLKILCLRALNCLQGYIVHSGGVMS